MSDRPIDAKPPAEFDLSDIEVASTDATGDVDSLNELLQLRDSLVRSERRLFQMEQDHDEQMHDSKRLSISSMQIAVDLVDQLGRMVAAAQADAGDQVPGETGDSQRQDATGESDSGVWLQAFRRLADAAAHTLEDRLSIVQVPLQGKDLRDLSIQTMPVARWVAVRKGSDDGSRMVNQEIRGLWVRCVDDKVLPIQRGEVTLDGS